MTVQSVPSELPGLFRGVYSGAAFVERLRVYDGVAIDRRSLGEHWLSLTDVWRRASVELQTRIASIAPAVARELEELRTWEPPSLPPARAATRFGELYGALARIYLERRDAPRIERVPPGPFDERHPGFTLAYDAKRGALKIAERAAPSLERPFDFEVPLARPLRSTPIVDGVLGRFGTTDAWSLAALRALLVKLHEGEEPAALALEQDLSRPAWDQLLENLGSAAPEADPREWAFAILEGHQDAYEVVPYARSALKGGKWKKARFDALYANDASALERDVARVAMCTPKPGHVRLGTPQAHELFRLLAQHPRVHHSPITFKVDPALDPRADLVVGELTMNLERAPNGVLTPRFLVGGRELSASMLAYTDDPFRGARRGPMIASVYVPPSLARWVSVAGQLGPQLSFPAESVPKLEATTRPLVATGVATIPRDALGHELGYDPRPAFRIEWRPHGEMVIELFVSVHPSAPLVPPGLGPELYTFDHGGRRVFVERDLASERKIAESVRAHVPVPISWEGLHGSTDGVEETVLVADWLDRNPLDLRIEVALGRRPSVVPWADANRSMRASAEGKWLVLDGVLDVKGARLTLGDVLEAARLARRYVRAADGVFIELSKDVVDKLGALAFASDLAPDTKERRVRVHHAFGPVLAEAGATFGAVEGLDLTEYARRFRTREKKPKVPPLDRGKLRDYQKEGVAWMLRLASWAPGCVLADDMGLGKTVQTAAVLKGRAKLGPQLIVAPASVSANWVSELRRFVPSIADDIAVVSYQMLQRRSEEYAKKHFATVVLDEAQYVKNVAAQRTDAVRSLSRDFTIALTGTPLENHLGELFSIVDLVFPGLLGSEPVFRERFRKPIEGQRDATRLGVLGRLLAPFLLRRTRADVLRELPPREEITVAIDLSPAEQKRYLALRRACEQQFAKRKKEETAAQLRIALFAAITRLRQLACDARLVDDSFEGESTKIARTVELATELAQEGNHALVFSQFTRFLERIHAELERAGLRVAFLSGDTPVAKRKAIIDAFQRGDFDVFCVSLLAGGTGLNLTKASYVIHTDPWWNPAAEEQATSRAHRMGQREPVTVYKLVARGTIEEAVLAMHADKRDLASAVLEGKANAKAITSNELLDLIRFGGR